jgi:hypothetical protein
MMASFQLDYDTESIELKCLLLIRLNFKDATAVAKMVQDSWFKRFYTRWSLKFSIFIESEWLDIEVFQNVALAPCFFSFQKNVPKIVFQKQPTNLKY